MNKQLTVLVKEPGKEPRIAMVGNDRPSMCELIGCRTIEVVRLPRPCSVAIMVCDEEGKLNNRQPNFCLGCDVIVGTVFFCCVGGDGEFRSITPGAQKAAKAVMMLGKLEV